MMGHKKARLIIDHVGDLNLGDSEFGRFLIDHDIEVCFGFPHFYSQAPNDQVQYRGSIEGLRELILKYYDDGSGKENPWLDEIEIKRSPWIRIKEIEK